MNKIIQIIKRILIQKRNNNLCNYLKIFIKNGKRIKMKRLGIKKAITKLQFG